MAELAEPTAHPEPLAWLTRWDWLWVGFAWLTIAWAAFVTIDALVANGEFGFDFLPIVVGVPVLLAGWRALRVRRRVDAAVEGLSGGAGLDVTGDFTAFRVKQRRAVRVSSYASGAAIALALAAYFAWAFATGIFSASVAEDFVFSALLVGVCVGVGFVIGFLLGRLFGYGRLLTVMRDSGVGITRIDTEQARAAIRQMEDVLRYAITVTLVMCHWFVPWFGLWALGFDPRGYRTVWGPLFLALWIVSFSFYVFAARGPTLAFRRRLHELRGGAAGQAAHERQLAEARDDQTRLKATAIDERERFYDERELAAFVAELEARRAPSRLPPRWALDLVAVWIAALLIGSIALSLWRGLLA